MMNNKRQCFRNGCSVMFDTRHDDKGLTTAGLCGECKEVFLNILQDNEEGLDPEGEPS